MTQKQTVLTVALLNLAYFGIEFGAALAIGSVSLFADSIDFLEDASINLLILVALAWGARQRVFSRARRSGQSFGRSRSPGWESPAS